MSSYTWGREVAVPSAVGVSSNVVHVAPTARDLHVTSASASGPAAVSAGYRHSLILFDDGSMWSLGSNAQGQLGRKGMTAHCV